VGSSSRSAHDVDLNAELRAAGLANVATGVVGGFAGYHTLAFTVLGIRMAGPHRLIGVGAAAVCAAALVAGPIVISTIPAPVLGGLLLLLGFGFLLEWVWEARRRLPLADYLILLLIVVVIGGFGFLPGVAVGLIAAIILFVLDSSRMDLVRYRLAGETFASSVERPERERDALGREGHRIDVLVLHGFLFFGSANRLLEECEGWVAEDRVEGPLYLVLDVRLVRGLDSSAAMTFEKMRLLAARHEATLVLSGIEERTRRRLEHHGLMVGPGIRFEPDLDRAVEWCEESLLSWLGLRDAGAGIGSALQFPDDLDLQRLHPYLEPLDVLPGDRLVRQGESPEELFLVESATLTIELELRDGTVRRLRRLLPGTIVGEMGLYVRGPRSTSVVVEAPGRVFRMSRTSFEAMERDAPEVAAAFHRFVARLLAQRLGYLLRTLEDLLR
jgi:sulfate permease, SulP family